MSPKSLLRHPKVISPKKEFTKGSFREVIQDGYADKKKTKRIILCTGKIYYDLHEYQVKNKRKDVALVRIEQLYPFPEIQLDDVIESYTNASELFWVQEEPSNMGYWAYMLRIFPRRNELKVIARKPSASPATGYAKVHNKEQEDLVNTAFEI